MHTGHPDREADWPREAAGSGAAFVGDEESEKDKAAAAAASAAAKPPMMILKRPTPPSTPSTSGRLTCEGAERPPALSLSPSSKVRVNTLNCLSTNDCVVEYCIRSLSLFAADSD